MGGMGSGGLGGGAGLIGGGGFSPGGMFSGGDSAPGGLNVFNSAVKDMNSGVNNTLNTPALGPMGGEGWVNSTQPGVNELQPFKTVTGEPFSFDNPGSIDNQMLPIDPYSSTLDKFPPHMQEYIADVLANMPAETAAPTIALGQMEVGTVKPSQKSSIANDWLGFTNVNNGRTYGTPTQMNLSYHNKGQPLNDPGAYYDKMGGWLSGDMKLPSGKGTFDNPGMWDALSEQGASSGADWQDAIRYGGGARPMDWHPLTHGKGDGAYRLEPQMAEQLYNRTKPHVLSSPDDMMITDTISDVLMNGY